MSGVFNTGTVGLALPSSFYDNAAVNTSATTTIVSSGTNARGVYIAALTIVCFGSNSNPLRLQGGISLGPLIIPAGQALEIKPVDIENSSYQTAGVYVGGTLYARCPIAIPAADMGGGIHNKIALAAAYKVL